jgi:outer membrane protein assembly factor BamB
LRRPDGAFFFLCAAAAAWAGCDAIAGIQDGIAEPADGSTGDAPADVSNGDSSSKEGGKMDGASSDSSQESGPNDGSPEADAPPPLGDCGDMSGLQAGAPWPMEGRCPSHAGRSDGKGPTSAAVQWTLTLGGDPTGVAVAADGTIYVCAGGMLSAHLPSNAFKWSFADCASTPAIAADGTVYVGGAMGTLYALKPADGSTAWMFAPGGTGTVVSPTVGGDGTIYTGWGPNTYAVKPDGTMRWTFPTTGTVNASLAIGPSGTVYVPADVLYALKPDGTLKWKEDLGNGGLSSFPVVDKNENIFVGNGDAILVSPAGTRVWDTPIGGNVRGAPALGTGGLVYFGGFGGAFAAINGATGTKKWATTAGDSITQAPAADTMGNVYFGCNNHTVYGYSATGTLLFNGPISAISVMQPAIGAGGVLYVGSGISSSALQAIGP